MTYSICHIWRTPRMVYAVLPDTLAHSWCLSGLSHREAYTYLEMIRLTGAVCLWPSNHKNSDIAHWATSTTGTP